MMKRVIILFAFALLPMHSQAATAYVEVNPTMLQVSTDGSTFYLYFEPLAPDADPNNCGHQDHAVSPTSDNWKILHATILAALLADKPLSIRLDGCTSNRPSFDRVRIYKQ